MNPCLKPKRQIAVAVVKSSTGVNQRIELLTVADLVHLFALAMGYRPDIAFSFGVISRSVPEVQAGECDVTLDVAQKAIRIAGIINACRESQGMPEDVNQVEAILGATAHVHTVEQAYTELCDSVPNIQDTFNQQYRAWVAVQDGKEQNRIKPSFFRRIANLLSGGPSSLGAS